ncbi:MAG: DUF255 domain-containing protein [bacterium]|nr:thioredoxin domain-containing protein [Gammaproteobacteria bacterium]HIL97252.1 thioredoxin domain-containing protein [Pseudomonadales bacterium]
MQLRFLVLVLLFFNLAGSARAAEEIHWYDWGLEAFDAAAKQNKLILVNVGMEGCAACGRMEHITYQDEAVIRRINESFIPIAVDSEARPDIGERYSDWAWPATAFLTPQAEQILAIAGNRNPDNFTPLLDDLTTRQLEGRLGKDSESPYAAPGAPAETELTLVRSQVRGQIDSQLNETWGGWQRRGLGTEGAGARLKHLFLRAHMFDNQELTSLAIKTADRFVDGIDPVWGGVYVRVVYPKKPGDKSPAGVIPEKRIASQANAVNAFADGYEITGDEKYRRAMGKMMTFFEDWFLSPEGGFYSNQKIDPPGLTQGMTARAYWSLNSHDERARYGIPPIDHVVYTDQNAKMIEAMVRAYEAFAEQRYLDLALKSANNLVNTRLGAEGYLFQNTISKQVTQDDRLRPNLVEVRPYLSTQAWSGSAFLALYRATADVKWLNHAIVAADAMLRLLEDKQYGGFFGTRDEGLPIAARKPLEQNGRAAHFLYELHVYTKEERFESVAERTLQAVSEPAMIRREGKITGELAIALEKVTVKYVEFSVVGSPDDADAKMLFDASSDIWHPRKILHFEKPGRYPQRDQAALYICNPSRCSVPITDVDMVAKQAALFRLPSAS